MFFGAAKHVNMDLIPTAKENNHLAGLKEENVVSPKKTPEKRASKKMLRG